jgi:hypothetical protein
MPLQQKLNGKFFIVLSLFFGIVGKILISPENEIGINNEYYVVIIALFFMGVSQGLILLN